MAGRPARRVIAELREILGTEEFDTADIERVVRQAVDDCWAEMDEYDRRRAKYRRFYMSRRRGGDGAY
jgi:hypothetical protein